MINEEELERVRSEITRYHDQKRIPHVMGVEKACCELCAFLGLDGNTALSLRFAALMHDCTKNWKTEKHLMYLKNKGVFISEDMLRSEKTLHQLSGAYFTREIYPVFTDETVFSAISKHTTGGRMTICDAVLFLADYIEETRTFPDCVTLRGYFHELVRSSSDTPEIILARTMLYALDMTITDLIKNGKYINRDTVFARNFYLLITGETQSWKQKK
ncbi:MAG: HD domain-containing protein [Clostridia bacterium]|nr:HD domain-containing protein [Clostridia bacterium]